MTTRRPLAGRTIVVTRAAAQAQSFVTLLEAAGARVLQAPAIAIEPPPSWEPLDRALDEASAFAWLIFTSVNGVAMVDERLGARQRAWTAFGHARVAAIGPATAAALERHAVRVEVVPREYRAEGLVEGLRGRIRPGERVLLPRAARTRDTLVVGLTRLGARVTEVPAYTTRRVAETARRVREALAAAAVDAVSFTSSSTVRGFAELFTSEERRTWLGRVTVASIGPITAATAAEYGLPTEIMPTEYTIRALARAIAEHFEGMASGAAPAPRGGG